MEQDTDKCKACAMSLENQDDACNCEPGTCYHCCHCGDDCVCGCKNHVKKSDEKAEF